MNIPQVRVALDEIAAASCTAILDAAEPAQRPCVLCGQPGCPGLTAACWEAYRPLHWED